MLHCELTSMALSMQWLSCSTPQVDHEPVVRHCAGTCRGGKQHLVPRYFLHPKRDESVWMWVWCVCVICDV
jgi:hypothetical protein